MNFPSSDPDAIIQIRKAEPGDAPALAELIRKLELFDHIKAESAEATGQRVARHLDLCLADESHSVYVAVDTSGQVVGYTSAHWLPYLILAGVEGYVSELFIAASHRSRGIGTQLLERVKEEAISRGCSRLMLLNMRFRESYQRGFYLEQGWEEREQAASFVYQLPVKS